MGMSFHLGSFRHQERCRLETGLGNWNFMARRTAVLALFASMVLPQCSAVKFHQHHVTGVYLSRDAQILQALTRHTPGTYWINGYRMTVTQQTQICWHDSALQFHPRLSRAGQPFSSLSVNSPCETALPATDVKDVWLQYRGVQKIPFRREFEFKVTATRIDVWKSDSKENPPSSQSTVPRPAWKTLCASASPHELRYPNEGPIDVTGMGNCAPPMSPAGRTPWMGQRGSL